MKNILKKKLVLRLVYILIVVGALGFGIVQYRNNNDLRNNPDKVAAQESTRITEKVGAFYNLPSETPTIATVEDKEKLKDQPFFKDAVNGDRILIYQGARLAIIYRESENRLINVGPIAITDTPAAAPAPAPAPADTDVNTNQ